jgi:hypothetical protein
MAYFDEQYLKPGKDLRRVAVIFGGKRPALFLKRELANRHRQAFYPPRFFTMDEWMRYVVQKKDSFKDMTDLNQCYLLYRLAKTVTPEILAGREDFARFLPWTKEILSFIDQLDLENVSNDKLRHIEANARIGYPVPEDINKLLESLVTLRQAYHERMHMERTYSRGFQYRRAAQLIENCEFPEFDAVLFCNIFYLNRSEEVVVKNFYERGLATVFFQGDERRWPVLKRVGRFLGTTIREAEQIPTPSFALKLYAGFDIHSQVGLVREILKDIKNLDRTVIVLPNPDHIIPLLSEISHDIQKFNISMGYPLKRSSLFALLQVVFEAQLSRGSTGYYTRDYLRTLRHPLVKNLHMGAGVTATRVLIHKIEEILTGQEQGDLSGLIFIDPQQVARSDLLYDLAEETLLGMGIIVSRADLQDILTMIHQWVFREWEPCSCFTDFSGILKGFVDFFCAKSFLKHYPLNLKIVDKIYQIIEELSCVAFGREFFAFEEMVRIFYAKMEGEIVSFIGSPLKGLQILGLFETRSLNFDDVIVLDVNEGTLPHLNICEPLIPREVMVNLGLDRLEQEEEIQRYQFMRLISAAKQVHLIYQEGGKDKQRSRFVEELVWEAQKDLQRLDAVTICRSQFRVGVAVQRTVIHKTPQVVDFLRHHRYSASSINLYLRSPVEFYYTYVLGLREKEDLLNEPENRQVGTFIHGLLEEGFKGFIGRQPVIDERFRHHFQQILESRFAKTLGKVGRADAFLLKTVIEERMRRFLDMEVEHRAHLIKEVLYIEKRFEDMIPLSCGNMSFVYRVDRVDRMLDGEIVIIDYKAGSIDPMPKEISLIESMALSRSTIAENIRSFQIPLYYYYLDKTFPNDPVNAAFYNLRTVEIHKLMDSKMPYDRSRITQAYMRALDFIVSELLNPQVPFCDEAL